MTVEPTMCGYSISELTRLRHVCAERDITFEDAIALIEGKATVRKTMDRLDYFAGQALSGLLADPDYVGGPRNAADICWNFAHGLIDGERK